MLAVADWLSRLWTMRPFGQSTSYWIMMAQHYIIASFWFVMGVSFGYWQRERVGRLGRRLAKTRLGARLVNPPVPERR